VLKWIAYPIQHPGAKMKTTLVVHGPQGTGKNLFFEALMSIYGEYGDVLDQSALEDKFNDWASRKLFMIADEVVARSDVYHIKNKLKGADHRRPHPHQPEEFRGLLGAQPPQPGVPVERGDAGGARGRRSPALRDLDAARSSSREYYKR
jgi:hypothetical protein